MKAYEPKGNEWFEVMIRLTGKDKLCERCGHFYKTDDEEDSFCWYGLYPMTSDGENCPYFNKGERVYDDFRLS